MSRMPWLRKAAVVSAFAIAAAACGGGDEPNATDAPKPSDAPTPTAAPTAAPTPTNAPTPTDPPAPTPTDAPTPTTPATEPPPAGPDWVKLGLWDDGPCDASKEELNVGLQTVFASAVLTLQDQAEALEASATAFNARGGANGHCIKVTTCDDAADPNKALDCVGSQVEAGVTVTVNDTTPVATADVSAAYAEAGIPRFAISSNTDDLSDPNSYPMDGGGIGTTLMMARPILDAGLKKVAVVRVDVPAASALAGLFATVYGDDGLEVVADLPVPAGTTDYSQFITAALDQGAEAVLMPLGGQEGIQILRAGQQLDAKLKYSSSLGSYPPSDIASLGDYGANIILNAAIPPSLAVSEILDVLTADLATAGIPELERENLKSSPMRSWIGLYALLYILREGKVEDFSKENMKKVIDAAGPVPMLGLTSDTTFNTTHVGAWTRTGNGFYAFWAWDVASESFTKLGDGNFHKEICGTLGGPC